ncbi:MAG: DNA mismatch repair protein MutS [Desulfobacula sp.]|nr:DNA mismatch repair protein MutS [Desulfobacula sp.]
MTEKKNTPMMEQYLRIKDNYPDAILFYRMGDFYEMFQTDAIKASAILEIALTSRNKHKDDAIPMCGIPFRAADTYIAKLIENGCKVAICEQVEDPAQAKGLVRREVVRVITPGMILNESLLDKGSNNFLLALSLCDGHAGLACLDISTGTFKVTETRTQNGRIPDVLMDEALRIDPSEVVISAAQRQDPLFNPLRRAFSHRQITYIPKGAFSPATARQTLIDKFKTRSLEGFGCNHLTAGICAAGAIIHYVKETQFHDTDHVSTLSPYVLNSYLIIDDRSCRNLELLKNIQTMDKKGTLLSILDKTSTAMGSRTLKNWIRYPLKDKEEITLRLTAVEEAVAKTTLRKQLRDHLKSVYDLERLGSKISMGHGNARDLTALKNSLLKLPDLFSHLNQFTSPLYSGVTIKDRDTVASDLTQLAMVIDTAIREDAPLTLNEGGLIRDGYSKELDELIEMSRDGRQWIAKKGVEEKKKTGLSSLKIKYNKIFGYFIEVSKTQAKSVPETYIKKQTLVNSERFITDEIKTAESKILNAQEKRAALEYSLFCEIRDRIADKVPYILETASFLARVDVLLCFANTAQENNYTEPEINSNGSINITEGRHPVVEKLVQGERYVPNNIFMDNDTNQVLLITGTNMAGKSTILRQVALISFMAQIGSFVPVEKASLCILDKIFTRVGALDNLAQGQSTFMVEMEETANIVNNATHKSLVILDEIGRGTSTYDGMSIAWAVAEHLHDLNDKGVKTLFATHYHELTKLEEIKPRFKNFNIAVKEFNDNIVFLRRLVKGGTNKSYGIQVARLAGMPDIVINNAKHILSNIDKNSSDVPKPLPKQSRKKGKKKKKKNDNQMELFNHNEQSIKNILEKIDISSMTPLEAINLLNDLKQKSIK